MNDLIQEAFLHVEGIGDHVQAGHSDLVGPDGEIILPRIWELVIKPSWAVEMHMWPMADDQAEGGAKEESLSTLQSRARSWIKARLPSATKDEGRQ